MSKYGRLYEQASAHRRRLQELLPGKLVGNYTPADARRFAALAVQEAQRIESAVDSYARAWEAVEVEMAKEPDE